MAFSVELLDNSLMAALLASSTASIVSIRRPMRSVAPMISSSVDKHFFQPVYVVVRLEGTLNRSADNESQVA
jgi:hypothetical protein